jgi:hypothetical protein
MIHPKKAAGLLFGLIILTAVAVVSYGYHVLK